MRMHTSTFLFAVVASALAAAPARAAEDTITTKTVATSASTAAASDAATQVQDQRKPDPSQPGQPPPPRQPRERRPGDAFGISGFVHFGNTFFVASESFEAILDKSSGPAFGGGGQVTLPFNLFARVDVSRFREDGERAFVSNGEVFKLGIPTTITLTPIEFTGGYRRAFVFGGRRAPGGGQPASRSAAADRPRGGFRLIPFAGGGVGVVQYKETSDFAEAGDDVDESFTSYHVIGGVEVPIWRWIGVGAEYQHRWVPDGLGTGGVSAEFNETDLGGGTFRVRFIVGF